MTVIKINGAGILDDFFSIEIDGREVSWNTTRMRRDANRGRFGLPLAVPMHHLPPPDFSTGNLEREKIDWMKEHPQTLHIPSLAIGSKNDTGIFCICDGNHRLTALWEMSAPGFFVWICPDRLEREYRMTIEVSE
jgi:hypothetical protein